jgi:hypothetical protein
MLLVMVTSTASISFLLQPKEPGTSMMLLIIVDLLKSEKRKHLIKRLISPITTSFLTSNKVERMSLTPSGREMVIESI